MAKTWWSVATAAALVCLAVSLALGRWYVLGADHHWKVTLLVEGEMRASQATVATALPLNFRYQHIAEETFHSDTLQHRAKKRREPGRRMALWRRRPGTAGPQPFRLTSTSYCTTEAWAPTTAMARLTRVLDSPPSGSRTIQPARGIESTNASINAMAEDLAPEGVDTNNQVRAIYHYVASLPNAGASAEAAGALDCLTSGGGGPSAKARLLVALCRNRGIPARVISGVPLEPGDHALHRWAEAWIYDTWIPMCPTRQLFGTPQFVDTFLVLQVGNDEPITSRGAQVRARFHVDALETGGREPSTPAKEFWRRLSLYSLRPAEQHLVKFLLLLPLAALIVSIYRAAIGVPTFGTFGPALLGLAFLDLRSLHWGLIIFVLIVLVGWGLRHALEYYHLLLVPRTAALLTLIVLVLLTVIVAASHYGITATQYVALFPLIILTHLVERFWTLEAEDGTLASFKALGGTILVAVTVSVLLSPEFVSRWMFRYPETLALALAAELLLGRYTGYRLTELYRFADLIREADAKVDDLKLHDAKVSEGAP
jgi:hypothetical protein